MAIILMENNRGPAAAHERFYHFCTQTAIHTANRQTLNCDIVTVSIDSQNVFCYYLPNYKSVLALLPACGTAQEEWNKIVPPGNPCASQPLRDSFGLFTRLAPAPSVDSSEGSTVIKHLHKPLHGWYDMQTVTRRGNKTERVSLWAPSTSMSRASEYIVSPVFFLAGNGIKL